MPPIQNYPENPQRATASLELNDLAALQVLHTAELAGRCAAGHVSGML